jgi:hypothetical protein
MTKIFLRAKHWHIFTITFALPFILQMLLVPLVIVGDNPMIVLRVMPVTMAILIVGFFGWIWSIGTGLQSKVPADAKMNVNRFRLFFFIPLVYLVLFLLFIAFGTQGLIESGQEPDPGRIALIIGIILPIHFFVVFCMFYCLYFVSKTYKTVELQREVSFSDFAGEFFLFWFYPIGVWILQPKINKMSEG